LSTIEKKFWLLLTGLDLGLFQSSEPVIDDELKIQEVPEALRDPVPLAKK